MVHAIEAFFPSEAELHWHNRFADKRQNGEWFVLTDEEVAEFTRVSRMETSSTSGAQGTKPSVRDQQGF